MAELPPVPDTFKVVGGGLTPIEAGPYGSPLPSALGSLGLGIVAAPYVGAVSNRTLPLNTFNAGLTQGNGWTTHRISSKCATIQVGDANWYVTANVGEQVPPQAITVTRYLEYPLGTFTQLTYGGATSVTIQPGTEALSDPVAAPPVGATFRLRIHIDAPGGYAYCSQYNPMDTDVFDFSGTATLANLLGAASGNGPSAFLGLPPLLIIGTTSQRTVNICGDSRAAGGNGDRTLAGFALGGGDQGAIARSIGPDTGYHNFGVAGDTCQNFVTAGKSDRRQRLMKAYATDNMFEFGQNDLNSGGRTPAQLIGDLNTLMTLFPAQRNRLSTLVPFTTIKANAITGITQTGGVATATVGSTSSLVNGQLVGVSGAAPTGYNGFFNITITSGTTFTYPVAAGTASPATTAGTYNDAYNTAAGQTLGGVTSNINAVNLSIRTGAVSNIVGIMDQAVAIDPRRTGYWGLGMTYDGVHANPTGVDAIRVSGVVPHGTALQTA